MCGRYASTRAPADLIDEFGIDRDQISQTLDPDYNVAPTDQVYAVVERPPSRGQGEDASADAEPERQLRTLRWGLVPFWAKNPGIGNKMINARMETVAEKPAFKQAFAKRRCLLPADGYYEWYETGQQTKAGKPVKQPYFIRSKDGTPLAMAGLYEIWRDPARGDDDPRRFLWSATVLTTTAEDAVGQVHDRMPLLVDPARWADWLDPRPHDKDTLLGLLVPAVPGLLDAYPVSTAVNNVRNNGPELIEPLPLDHVDLAKRS
ncbi:MAG: SOS response-associated peptidase [Nocardioidaceae bacterium]